MTQALRYLRPRTVEEAAAAILAGAKPLAGGTVLGPGAAGEGSAAGLAVAVAVAVAVADLALLEPLRELRLDEGAAWIGALVSVACLEGSAPLGPDHAALRSAAASIGNPHVRRAATVGGNLALRVPSASLPPALLVLDAEALLFGPAGPSACSVEVLLGAGLPSGALITAVRVPVVAGRRSACVKYAGRHASGRAIASVAASVRIEGGAAVEPRVAVSGLCRAARLRGVERLLAGRPLDAAAIEAAARAAAREAPFEDVDFAPGEEQRRRLVAEGVRRVLGEVRA